MSVYIELQRLLLTVQMDDSLRFALMEIFRKLEEEISSLNDRVTALE